MRIPTETWVLPRPRKSKYPGGFPLHFERKLIRSVGLDELKDRDSILHPFGGMAEYGLRVDLNTDVQPDYVADAHDLPIGDESFDLIILDPPYDNEKSKKLYGTGAIHYQKYISEAVRVCKTGGIIAVYHWVMTPRPAGTIYHKRIVILTRVWHRPRVCCLYKKETMDVAHQ